MFLDLPSDNFYSLFDRTKSKAFARAILMNLQPCQELGRLPKQRKTRKQAKEQTKQILSVLEYL